MHLNLPISISTREVALTSSKIFTIFYSPDEGVLSTLNDYSCNVRIIERKAGTMSMTVWMVEQLGLKTCKVKCKGMCNLMTRARCELKFFAYTHVRVSCPLSVDPPLPMSNATGRP
jgi:hypothetical protein